VVPAKGLLVMSRADQGCLLGLLEQVDPILLSFRGLVRVKGFVPWGVVV
jgi:hypothetical protein